MKRSRWALVLLAIAVRAFAQPSPAEIRRKEAPSFAELVSLPLVYQAPHLETVSVMRDLVYRKTPGGDLRMDIYLPKNSRRDHPVAFFIHGGVSPDEHPKDWGIYRSWGRTIAASGIIAVVFNQRLGYPARRYDEGFSDVREAMEYVRSRKNDIHAKDAFCLVAFSGGGTMLAPFLSETPADVRCLVGFYPVLDTVDTINREAEVTDEQRRKYSAVAVAASGQLSAVPIFIARAGHDQIPGVKESIDRFLALAMEKDANVTFVNHPTGLHGFDTRNDDPRSREIIVMAIDFLRRNLTK